MDTLVLLLVCMASIGAAIYFYRKSKGSSDIQIEHFSTIQSFQSLGELTAFRVSTKEIVTASDHYFGNFGQKYFRWLISDQKMAIIFQFDIDFKYDLRSPEFRVEESEESINIFMPPCQYTSNIKDIKFYDEQGAKLMPWLLPNLINDVFREGFDEKAKNKLIDEAKIQVGKIADELASSMESSVRKSALSTLEALGKSLSKKEIKVDFSKDTKEHGVVNYEVKDEKSA